MMHKPIIEPARYYDAERLIVMRQGLLLVDERRYLWHELVHADRGDRACHGGPGVERTVEREAVTRALPRSTLEWAIPKALDWHELADLLKVPEEWVHFRWSVMLRSDKEHLRAVNRRLAADL